MPEGLLATMSSGCGSSKPRPERAPSKVHVAREVRSAWVCSEGPFSRTSRLKGTAAQKAGIRYEKKALQKLQKDFGASLLISPWFKFRDVTGFHYCQPDAVLHSEAATIIFEVKIRILELAWWQLRQLYEPVVKRAFREPKIPLILVCKHVDLSVPFPEPLQLLPTARAALGEWDHSKIGLLQCNL